MSKLLSDLYKSNALLISIVLCGVATRIIMYLYGRSLWSDEAMLALNITNKSFYGLWHPLDYHQGAPIGFLLVEKLINSAYEHSDYALRAFPLICGGMSILLFYRLAKHCIEPQYQRIALFLFAMSPYLIYYSSEVKQYSSDVTISIILYISILHFHFKKGSWVESVYLGLAGAISIWFSHPAIFVLAGLGFWVILSGLRARDWPLISKILVACAVWIVSFCGLYYLSLAHLTHDMYLVDFHQSAFMPFPPRSIADVKWFETHFLEMFHNPLGLSSRSIWVLFFVIGSITMWKENAKMLSLLISPFPFILLASGIHKYPFTGRFILFIAPIIILVTTKGMGTLYQVCSMRYRKIYIAVICIILLGPLCHAASDVIHPSGREEVKPAMSYVNEHWKSGDVIYLYYGAIPAFRYYSDKYNMHDRKCIVGTMSRDNVCRYLEDLDKLRGNDRVWVLISHNYNWKDVDEEKVFVDYLNSIGMELQHFNATGASVYLYNLTQSRGVNTRGRTYTLDKEGADSQVAEVIKLI